jgi:hypothetical protein
MNQISSGLFSKIQDEVKRDYNSREPPKPEVAKRFAQKIVMDNPQALNAIKELQMSYIVRFKLSSHL